MHCIQLTGGDAANGPLFSSLWTILRKYYKNSRGEHVGAVCLNTKPALILGEACAQAQNVCKRQFGCVPQVTVNGLDADEFFNPDNGHLRDATSFPYVDIHLYYIFFEVLKNACKSSIMKARSEDASPEIAISLLVGSSMDEENERCIKIADNGEGMDRPHLQKVWSYFYSTENTPAPVLNSPEGAENLFNNSTVPRVSLERNSGSLNLLTVANDQSHDARVSTGLGLPVSRVLARYFGGEIVMNSIPQNGSDVYIYL